MQFPRIEANNELRKHMLLPIDLAGAANLLFVVFQQWQEAEVATWLPAAEALAEAHPAFDYYELLLIGMNWLSHTVADQGLPTEMIETADREHTITIERGMASLRQALGLADEDHIYVFLLSPDGKVIWDGRGPYAPDLEEALGAAVGGALGKG